MLSISIPIDLARMVAGAVLAVALVALAAGAWIGRHAPATLPTTSWSATPPASCRSRLHARGHGRRRVRRGVPAPGRRAPRHLLLHHAGRTGDVLAVRDSDTTYRYVFPDGRQAASRRSQRRRQLDATRRLAAPSRGPARPAALASRHVSPERPGHDCGERPADRPAFPAVAALTTP